MLTDATRRQLQRLRFLLEEALTRSQDPTEVGRHSALILLDGACEYAMAIGLGHHGRSTESFPKKFALLRETLNDWKPDAWASILQLHGARNQAQHHGTVVDASNMPGWISQTQRFIDSLVVSAFDVELRTVLLAESVETEEVRLQLVDAEKAREQGDALGAFAATISAFDSARNAWRGQRVESVGQLQLQYSGLRHLGGIETDPTNVSLIRFEDLLEVGPFAPDIGEYHWLLARRGELEHQIDPTLDTAHRAFLFVLAWVLRWEAFATRYEARRYPPPSPHYEPPVTGSDHPVIVETAVEEQQQVGGSWLDPPTLENVRFLIRVVLADVPATRRDIWAQEVGAVLNEAVANRFFEDLGAAHVGSDGIIRFHGASARITGEEIRTWVENALVEGDPRYREKRIELEAREASRPELADLFAAAVASVETNGIVAGVTSDERDDGSLWIGVQLRRDEDPMFGHALDNVVHAARSGLVGVDYFDTTLWFVPSYNPNEAAALVAAVAVSYAEQAAVRRHGIAAVEERRQALSSELRAEPQSGSTRRVGNSSTSEAIERRI
jgi:hypothetical protein